MEKKAKSNVGVGIAVLMQLAGFFLVRSVETASILGGAFLFFISVPVFIWGCMNYAEGKGHSKWVGLVGLAGIIGLIVLIILPDQDHDGSGRRLQLRKIIALMSLLCGFGLVVLGVWLHHLGDDIRLERLLHPWPAVCMVSGACVVVASLVMMLRDQRR